MEIGTKSVLFGAHQFLIHPLFVARAWWKLYGFPFDPRLWIAFFLHDLGYIGKPNMDGPEGEGHPFFAAKIMLRLFGYEWFKFCLYHSRFLANKYGRPHSKLCVADKLALTLEPAGLYLIRVCLTGELDEYMSLADTKYENNGPIIAESPMEWFESLCKFLRKWVDENK